MYEAIVVLLIFLPSLVSLEAQRRRLAPAESIIAHIDSKLANGEAYPQFTLTANIRGSLFAPAEPFSIDVALAKPSLDEGATFSTDEGNPIRVNSNSQFLISAEQSGNSFAILSIDRDSNTVSGIVQKDGKLVKLEQREGGETLVTDVNYEPPKDWACTALKHDEDHGVLNAHDRKLTEYSHDHIHKNHSSVDLSKDLDLNLLDADILKGRRKIWATDSFPNKYTYQVDLFIEVDTALVTKHGNLDNAISYVNALITAINQIYMREIDTRLNVLHIRQTSMYDGYNGSYDALMKMQETYEDGSWHYTSGSGHQPDLHHGIFAKDMHGGIAYVGAICSSWYGYGVSSGVVGSLTDIDGSMFWDIKVIAHELGHNFGAGHTHNIQDFNPVVDRCGLNNCYSPNTNSYISSGEGTIMSYCHSRCAGGSGNIGHTFGGQWNEGLRSDINSWDNTGTFGYEPRRVSKLMYDFVSSQSCVDPYLSIPTQTCTINSDCHDGNSCTTDVCNAGRCINTMRENCCGNFICEVGEASCSDCGPLSLQTPRCYTCWRPKGMMFNVEALSSNVTVSGLKFYADNGSTDVSIYTVAGNYNDYKYTSSAWTLIFSSSYAIDDTWFDIQANFNDIIIAAGSIQAFYIYATGVVLSADAPPVSSSSLAENNMIKVAYPSRAVDSLFGSDFGTNLAWVGSVLYSVDPPIPVPTPLPTPNPTRLPKLRKRGPRTPRPTPLPTNNPTAVRRLQV